jgi:hypothetical protein
MYLHHSIITVMVSFDVNGSITVLGIRAELFGVRFNGCLSVFWWW